MPSKTTTQKAANKISLKRRFDLTNRKVQFFVVIAIVAVLGGGYLTVKSFANTVVATWQGNRIINFTLATNRCTYKPGTEAAKNNIPTLDISCGAEPGTTGFFTVSGMNLLRLEQGNYESCVRTKGAGTIYISLYTGNNYQGGVKSHKLNNDGNYYTYCSAPVSVAAGTPMTSHFQVSGPALMKVSEMQLRKVAVQPGPTTPTPAPTK